jgi:DNA polymerase V
MASMRTIRQQPVLRSPRSVGFEHSISGEVMAPALGGRVSVPLYDSGVSAGFPSPADDYKERKLDLNDLLIDQPEATFFVRASGDSMLGAGIHDGDLLVVDRSVSDYDGRVVIVAINGELAVKRFERSGRLGKLHSENRNYSPIAIRDGDSVKVWGVVTSVIHRL